MLSVQTRTLTCPGVKGVEPEPIACLEAARSWNGPHTPRSSATSARPGRRDATGMRSAKRWAASANKESIVVEAYHYAQQLDWRPGLGRDPVLDQRDHDRDHQRPDRQVVCGGRLRRGEKVRLTRFPEHGDDRGTVTGLPLPRHFKSMTLVERHVPRVGRVEVRGQVFPVHDFQAGRHEPGSEALSL